MNKQCIAVLCGGQSAEHEVSLESAKNVVTALDSSRYDVQVIWIDRSGQWWLLDTPDTLLLNPAMQPLSEPVAAKPLLIKMGSKYPLVIADSLLTPLSVDALFSVVH